jgi:hypothetical protein
MEGRPELIRLYGRLRGLEESLPTADTATVDVSIADDFRGIISKISTLLGEDLSSFQPPRTGWSSRGDWIYAQVIGAKVKQLRSYLEHGFQVGNAVVQVGTLFRSIEDKQLSERCSDLLSAPSNFDRVINQATQILEDRVRSKVGGDTSLSGAPLVNAYVKAKIAESKLVLASNDDEQRGMADILRGLVAAFRNPTHHQISDSFTREQALKVCGFIDNLLQIVDRGRVQQ